MDKRSEVTIFQVDAISMLDSKEREEKLEGSFHQP